MQFIKCLYNAITNPQEENDKISILIAIKKSGIFDIWNLPCLRLISVFNIPLIETKSIKLTAFPTSYSSVNIFCFPIDDKL